MIFYHESTSGIDFLTQFRRRLAVQFCSQPIAAGRSAYEEQTGSSGPDDPLLDHLSSEDLYDLRRDLTGVRRDEPVIVCHPDDSFEAVGHFLLMLLGQGAVLEGAHFLLSGERIRVIGCPGQALSRIKARFVGEIGPRPSPDYVVCVGALEDGGTPANVVRTAHASTVVRPQPEGTWLTLGDAISRLGLAV